MIERLLSISQKFNVSMEALAALGARLRVDSERLTMDPAIAQRVDGVIEAMGVSQDDLASLSDQERRAVAGLIRSFFRQAGELLEQPERPPGWTYVDAIVLETQGRASMAIVPVIQAIAPQLADLSQRLLRPGARFLDVGTGAGWLAVALVQAFGDLRVTGIDIWEPALELARANTAHLKRSIEIRCQNVIELTDAAEYDAVFLPGPFLPADVVAGAVERAFQALKPGGWLLFGVYAPTADALSTVLTELRVVRSGGHPWQDKQVQSLLDAAGYESTRAFDRTWQMPMTFVVGRRPE